MSDSTSLLRTPVAANLTRWLAASLTLANGIIHWMLWSNGYRGLRIVGPAFLMNTMIAVVLAILIVVRPSTVVGLAALVFSLGTLAAFLLSETVGLFGFRASWDGQGVLAAIVETSAALSAALWLWVTRPEPVPVRTRN